MRHKLNVVLVLFLNLTISSHLKLSLPDLANISFVNPISNINEPGIQGFSTVN